MQIPNKAVLIIHGDGKIEAIIPDIPDGDLQTKDLLILALAQKCKDPVWVNQIISEYED